ncbi:hypothetical protein REPUB_Repub08aG0107500 [Reevesia pubescens]
MANNNGSNNNDREESNPLLSKQVVEEDEKKKLNGKKPNEATTEVAASPNSDIEVCPLGSMAPCVLYKSNVERLRSTPRTFAYHCLPYYVLYMIGNHFYGWNFLAPWLSHPTRTAIRRKFNLEGTCEVFNRSCGCCGTCEEDEVQREQCKSACDFVTHVLCHACALCQEGRELRQKLPHPRFSAQPILVMIPHEEQTMGRGT